jgi:hypothetical protein
MSYWRVPLEVLEDQGELATWALAAIRAAGNPAAPRKRGAKRRGQRSPRKRITRKKRAR